MVVGQRMQVPRAERDGVATRNLSNRARRGGARGRREDESEYGK